jgi:hypothetical protein
VAYGVRYMKRQEQIGWIFSGVITFFVFIHNQPWPYVFIWCIPFIALWSDRPLAFIGGRYGQRFMAVALAVIAVFSFVRNVKYVGHSNLLQRQVVTQAQSLLNPQDAYCDGIGMVVNRPQAMKSWWDKQKLMKILQDAKTGESREIEEIFLKQPKVWLLSYRTDELEDILNPYFADSYIRIFPNVLVSGVLVSGSGETMFMNRWKGEYRLFSPKGRPLDDSFFLNSQTVSGVVRVPLGESLLSLKGPASSAYLLPADVSIPFEIPTRMKQMLLFAYVYTY